MLHSRESSGSEEVGRHFSIGIGVGPNQMFGLIADLNGDALELPAQMAQLGGGGRAIQRALGRPDVDTVVSSITELVSELRELRPDLDEQEALLGVGVSIGGHINGRTGEVILSPQMGWWSPVPFAERLKETTHVETVVVENDVNALAVGALLFGDVARAAPAGFDPDWFSSFAVVNLTTGIGVGLVLGTDLYRGATSLAGEFGHFPVEEEGRLCVCGKHGCLETVAGGTAVLKAIREAVPTISSIEQAAGLVRSGDEVARHAFEQAGRALGRGLAGLINLLNLRLIILCGESAMLKCDPYMTQVRQSFHDRAFSTAAKDCVLIEESRTTELEARGAASMVFEHLRDHLLDRQRE